MFFDRYRNRRNHSGLRLAFLTTTALSCLSLWNGVARAQVIINGGATENVPGTQASPWNIGDSLTVGDATDGTLNIGVGGVAGVVTNTSAIISSGSTGVGRVTVTGAGSNWSSSENFYVGSGGAGFMTVQGGATVDSATLGGSFVASYVGYSSGSVGSVDVQDAGSVWTTNTMEVGGSDGSRGFLTISNGGRVNTTDAIIGDLTATSGAGSVFVLGTGSLWDLTSELTVGNMGTGSLNVDSGGTVAVAGDAYIGRFSGGNGIVSVSGAGSSLTVAGSLIVGQSLAAGVLTIADSGVVNVGGGAGTVRIAASAGANGIVSIGGAFGQTAAAAGTLQAGLVQFGTGGSGILNFNHTDSNYIFAPTIVGNGAIIQQAGKTTLTANSNGFSGAITVNGGTLAINGSFTGTTGITVNSGGTLGGTGTTTNVLITSGGTLAPGNSIGTLTVGGTLTLNSGSTYAVEVSPVAADRVNSTGEAFLAGTVAATFANGTYLTKSYTIISADLGRNGTFNTLQTTNLPSGFTAALDYTSTDVLLNLTAVLGAQQIGGALPGNQQNVANALNGYFNNGGALPPQYVTLFGLTGQALVNALGQADGQNATGIQQSGFQATGQFLSLMLDPFAAQNAGAGTNARAIGFAAESAQMSPVATAAYAATPVKAKPIVYTDASRWNVWAAGFGGSQRTRGDAGAGTSDTTSRFGGFAAGADYRIAPRTTLGFALAGGGTSWGIADGLGGGKADVFQAGLYATHRWDAAYVAAALSYSWYGTTTDRTLGLAGTDVLRGRFDAHSFGGRVETGYRYALGNFGVTPQAALQVISIRTPSYGETAASGLSTFALNYAAQTANSTRSELGVMFDRTTLLESGNTVALRARAAWGHEFDAGRGVNATFQALPGASFTVNGARPSVDSALLSASADVGFARNWMVGAKFDGEFSSRTSSYAGTGRVKYAW